MNLRLRIIGSYSSLLSWNNRTHSVAVLTEWVLPDTSSFYVSIFKWRSIASTLPVVWFTAPRFLRSVSEASNQTIEANRIFLSPLTAWRLERESRSRIVGKGTRENITNLIDIVISDEFLSCTSTCHAMAVRNYTSRGGMLTAMWARLPLRHPVRVMQWLWEFIKLPMAEC